MTQLECHQVRIDEKEIAQVEGEAIVASVPRAQARSLRVRYERPPLALIGGATVALLLLVVSNFAMAVQGAVPVWQVLCGVGAVGALVLMPMTNRRTGFVLAVETEQQKTRKLRFGMRAKKDEVRTFVDAARGAGVDVVMEGKGA